MSKTVILCTLNITFLLSACGGEDRQRAEAAASEVVDADSVVIPAGNLRQLAAARSGGGGRGGGGGDNTWSGLVGAGNPNDDNSVGYVSIPGVGPIGSYGM